MVTKKETLASGPIKVIGLGGGGSKAVDYMYKEWLLKDATFILCNTDEDALKSSATPNKILWRIKESPTVENFSEVETLEQENLQEIKALLSDHTKTVFMVLAMGGNTGTKIASIIAKMSKEMGITTFGIVSKPFAFEGETINERAESALEKLSKELKGVFVVNNEEIIESCKDPQTDKLAEERAQKVQKMTLKEIKEYLDSLRLLEEDASQENEVEAEETDEAKDHKGVAKLFAELNKAMGAFLHTTI